MIAPHLPSRATLVRALPGVALCAALATAGFVLAGWKALTQRLHVSPLLLVILLGIVIASAVRLPDWLVPGMRLAQRPLLRWAVAGLGFRLSLGELWAIGVDALSVVVLATFASLIAGIWLTRRFGVPEKMGVLLSVGSSVCGASAVVAADTVVQAERRDTAVSLGVITLLGTIGIFFYPALARLAGMSDGFYGLFAGATLHEMAQVVAAGHGVSEEAVQVATVVKLARIALLAPIVVGLGMWLRRRAAAGAGPADSAGRTRVAPVPWFLVMFLVFTLVNSYAPSLGIPRSTIGTLVRADLWLLCVGMAGVGLQTGFRDVTSAGWRPVALGAAQWLLLALLAYGIARAVVT